MAALALAVRPAEALRPVPRNERAARTATSIGMEWVGETEKYYDLRLQVYRLRRGELDVPQLPAR